MPTAKDRKKSVRAHDEELPPIGLWPRVLWLFAAAVWAFAAASLVSFDRADPPTHSVWPVNESIANWGGPFGASTAYWMFRLLGVATLAPMLVGLAALYTAARGMGVRQPIFRVLGVVLLTAAACGLLAVASGVAPSPVAGLPGGTMGLVFAETLASRFGAMGATIWLGLLAAVALVVGFDRLVLAAPAWLIAQLTNSAGVVRKGAGSAKAVLPAERRGLVARWWIALLDRLRQPLTQREHDLDESPSASAARKAKAKQRRADARAEIEAAEQALEEAELEDDEEEWEYEDEEEEDEDAEFEDEYEEDEDEDDEEEDDDLPGAPQILAEDQLREKMAKLPVRFAGANRKVASQEDLLSLQNQEQLEGYRFPPLDLLEEPEEDFSDSLETMVREQAEALEAALQEYRLDGEVVGIESGPVITQYDVRLAPGTKVSKLQAISTDLARALKAVNVRIVGNQAGRDTVGVEVPNPKKEKVRLKELMADRARFEKMKLPMFLGKDAAGEPLIEDLTKMPHMLIAGTTGSGKSVCMNTIIMSWLYTKKPNELKLVLVDPKMVEMSQFKDIPHLMCPVITEMSRAAAILEWACTKMDERYELLAEAGCRDITGYNELEPEELFERLGVTTELEQARIPKRLPYMVFIIDELADLMMTNKEVEGSIIRISQKARAVGIHLILATQRPQANVVTGLIKSNMPCRVTFKVASGMDSRIVLDQKGGELLLGQGDMLFLSPRDHKLARAQGTLVDDVETRRVVRFLRDVARPSFERSLMQVPGSAGSDEDRILASQNNSSASLKAAQEDPMFDRAVEIVLETQRGSVSLVQRRLAIGYTRASRLIDLMGIAGIIGEHKGSVAREVMISPADWQNMKQLADEEAKAAGQEPVFAVATELSAEAASGEEELPWDEEDESAEDESEDESEDDAEDDEEVSEDEDSEDEEEWEEAEDEADEEEDGDEEEDEEDEEYDEDEEEGEEEEDEEEYEEEDEDDDEAVDEEEAEEYEPEPPTPTVRTRSSRSPSARSPDSGAGRAAKGRSKA